METISAPIEVLERFSRQAADTNAVMRSLVSHRGWVVPLNLFADDGERTRSIESMMILSTEARITPGELWVFTDREAALRAQAAGAPLGSYAGGMYGTELFRTVPRNTTVVRVNPYSSLEHTWTFRDGGGIEAAQIWADAIKLEDGFEGWRRTGVPDRTSFINYRAFITLDHPSGVVATLPDQYGMTNPAVAFTAPDCVDAFLSNLGAEQRAGLQRVTIGGNKLLDNASVLGIDGLVINYDGPGTMYALSFDSINSDSLPIRLTKDLSE